MESSPPNVPEELLQRLQKANERLHAAREAVEKAMAGTEYRHQERVNAAEDRFRQVERELEEIDQAIKDAWQQDRPAR